jgi:hypothetical protein
MNKIADFPRPLPRDGRGRLLPVVVMADYDRRTAPRFYVTLHELDGGWISHEYIGNRHHDALDAIDRLRAERAIGDIVYEKGSDGE